MKIGSWHSGHKSNSRIKYPTSDQDSLKAFDVVHIIWSIPDEFILSVLCLVINSRKVKIMWHREKIHAFFVGMIMVQWTDGSNWVTRFVVQLTHTLNRTGWTAVQFKSTRFEPVQTEPNRTELNRTELSWTMIYYSNIHNIRDTRKIWCRVLVG